MQVFYFFALKRCLFEAFIPSSSKTLLLNNQACFLNNISIFLAGLTFYKRFIPNLVKKVNLEKYSINNLVFFR